jgi:integration host factor subunit beta
MTRSELIDRIQQATGLPATKAEKSLQVVFDEIISALSEGRRVELRGFGVFCVRERQRRQGRNPRTGDPVIVPEKRVPFFKAGKQLKNRINGDV